MGETMLKMPQKIALTLGLPMLIFLGLRDSGEGLRRDALQAFALLAVILLGAGAALWADMEILWPLALAVVFLALLALALFTASR